VTAYNRIPYEADIPVMYPSIPLDAQAFAIIDPETVINCSGVSLQPKVVIRNMGSTTLMSCNIYFQLNTGSEQLYAWSGSLPTLAVDTIILPPIITSLGNHTFRFRTHAPNGGSDGNILNDTLYKQFSVQNNPVVANFSSDITSSCNIPASVQFTNTSQNAVSYLWNFGDGTTSTDLNPIHQYLTNGVFSVSLTAYAGICGSDQKINANMIQIGNVPPDANFSASNLTPVLGATVTFNDLSDCSPTSWLWSISPSNAVYVNSTSSTSQNPQVQFTQTGTYTLTLTATNAFGSDVEVKTNYINVINCSYCATSYSNISDEWISNVTFNTINNSSGSTMYSDFTGISTTVAPGSSYPISVTLTVNGSWTEYCTVFVDWDQNCVFGAGESYSLGSITGPGTLTTLIAVPSNALPGPTRMRVSMRYSTAPTGCDVQTFGEAEDYTVIVASSCITPGIPIGLTALTTGSTTANLSWSSGSPAGSPTVTYFWQVRTTSESIDASGSTTGTSVIATGLSSNTTYNFRVYASTDCDNTSSSWSINSTDFTTCVTPGVPTGLSAVTTGSTTANLSWSSGSPAGSPIVTYFWQVRTTGGSIVTSGSTTSTSATPAGLSSNTTYNFRVYASTDCNSTSSSWSINSTNFTTYPTNPVAIGVNPSNVCLGSSSQLFAGGAQGTVYWYSGSCGGTFVGTGNPIVVTPTATTTYYARNYNGHFSTECASGTVTVHTLPGISTAIHGWLCGDGSVNLSVTDVPSGCTIDWYSASSGGTALSTGSEQFTTPFLTNTTTYYAASRNTTTGCVSSNRVPVTATIIPVPSTPLAGMLNSVCEGEALHLTSSTIPGATYTWTGPMGYTSLEQNPTVSQSAVPSMSGHYEVTAEVDGCTSQPGTVDVQIGEVFEYNTTATVCDGNTYLWRGTTYSVAGVYTESYQTVLGCDSLYRLELNVAPVVHQTEATETYEYFLPYIWHGQTIMASGTYNASYQSIWGCDSTFALHLTVFPDPIVKALNVKVYLEGLYSTSNPGTMNQAYHSTGPQYAPGIADMLDIQLYDASTSLTLPVYEQQNVGLQTDGTATIADLPFSLNGEYYIVILHRNSIETWSAQPVIFSGAGPIGYDFTTSSNKAYGNNQKHVGSSHYAIFGGNTNQDSVIDGSDMSQVDNAVTQFMSGYIPEDVNGDGIIDGSDMSIIDNNSTNFIEMKKP
jgi:PKD repeat protein